MTHFYVTEYQLLGFETEIWGSQWGIVLKWGVPLHHLQVRLTLRRIRLLIIFIIIIIVRLN